MYRNPTHALLDGLRLLLSEGAVVTSRGQETRELRSHVMRIERPRERVLVMPERRNNVFASLAETMWVLGGRDDLDYLVRYLPRAGDFSDDGKTWRGAYGPRLRNWAGTDQLREVAKLLTEDPSTRRATMVIFDPARDFVVSKDIPCNNWLQFLVRDGKLHLTLGLRSNDAIWGFSGINTFEWSVLHEMMAHWTGTEVGTVTFMVASFHLYARHYERAEQILARARRRTLYDFGFGGPRFGTPFAEFDAAMKEFFALEAEVRESGAGIDARIAGVKDDFLRASLQMLRVYNLFVDGAPAAVLGEKLDLLPSSDLRVGAIEFLSRQKRLTDRGWLRLRAPEQAFFDDYWGAARETSLDDIYGVLRTLHEKKSRVYGTSWRKHGEVLGVFANITRKYDRIESVLAGARATADEGLVHTLADLSVYAGKYITFLAEVYPDAFGAFLAQHPGAAPAAAYHHNEGFDAVTTLLLGRHARDERLRSAETVEQSLLVVREQYTVLERLLTGERPGGQGEVKCVAAADLSVAAAQAMVVLARRQPAAVAAFAEEVELL